MGLQPYMLHGRMGHLLFFASEGALLVTGVLAASLVTRWRRWLTLTLVAATVLCRAGNFVGLAEELDLAAQLVFLAFLVCVTWSLIGTLLEHQTVQRNTLYGAACAYLFVGLSFTALYVVLEHVHPPALVADLARLGRADLAWADVVIFSFMTLTTVGYGDITPVSPRLGWWRCLRRSQACFFWRSWWRASSPCIARMSPRVPLDYGTRGLLARALLSVHFTG